MPLPPGLRCVAAELHVRCHSGMRQSWNKARCRPLRNAAIDSDNDTVDQRQFEDGTNELHSRCSYAARAMGTPISLIDVKSVAIASPGNAHPTVLPHLFHLRPHLHVAHGPHAT